MVLPACPTAWQHARGRGCAASARRGGPRVACWVIGRIVSAPGTANDAARSRPGPATDRRLAHRVRSHRPLPRANPPGDLRSFGIGAMTPPDARTRLAGHSHAHCRREWSNAWISSAGPRNSYRSVSPRSRSCVGDRPRAAGAIVPVTKPPPFALRGGSTLTQSMGRRRPRVGRTAHRDRREPVAGRQGASPYFHSRLPPLSVTRGADLFAEDRRAWAPRGAERSRPRPTTAAANSIIDLDPALSYRLSGLVRGRIRVEPSC